MHEALETLKVSLPPESPIVTVVLVRLWVVVLSVQVEQTVDASIFSE